MSQQIDMDAVIEELRKGWRNDGWSGYGNPDGPVCILGAFARVRDDGNVYVGAAKNPCAPIIREMFPERVRSSGLPSVVEDFNDHVLTTFDDVILVCEKARAAQGECHE